MSIHFTTKSNGLTGALKAFTEKNLLDIEKIAGEIIDAEVFINEEKLDFKVEISLKTRLSSFIAEGSDRLLKQALRKTITTLKNQAKRNKEKLKIEKKRQGKGGFFKRYLGREREVAIPRSADSILVSENFSRKPVTVEEALFFLRDSGENAYMFVNSENGRTAVLFQNREGGISLIEPEF
jgi:putative sigma-54 modulation protein